MANELTVQANRTTPSAATDLVVPRMIGDAGDDAVKRFLEFFAVTIRNNNTRAAYIRACRSFFDWADENQIGQLIDIEPIHIGAYIEGMTANFEPPTVKRNYSPPLALRAVS